MPYFALIKGLYNTYFENFYNKFLILPFRVLSNFL